MNEARRCGQCLGGSTHTAAVFLLVSAATRARRVPGAAVVVGAVVGGRSVSRKLVGADVGARFAAARSKHGEMNRKGPRASRHGAAVLRCNVRAEHHGRLEYHPAWEAYVGHKKCAHPVGVCAPNCASRVRPCMRLLALVCGDGAREQHSRAEGRMVGNPRSRTAVRECPQWEWSRSSQERA